MERIHPSDVHPYVWADHIHRYKWASQFSRGVVFDFACGVGYGSTYIQESPHVQKYYGADSSYEVILAHHKEYRGRSVEFLVAHSNHLPFIDNTFDTIICFETLEHLEDPDRLIDQFAKLIKQDGILIGSVPSREQEELIDEIYGSNPYHKTRFDFAKLQRLLNRHFKHVSFYKQSLEVGSILVPMKEQQITPIGKIIQDVSLPELEHGNFLFVAAKENIRIEKNLENQFSFTPGISLFKVDRSYNQHIRGLEEKIQGLTSKNLELELIKQELSEEVRQMGEENARLESESRRIEKALKRLREENRDIRKELSERPLYLERKAIENQSLITRLQEIEQSRSWRIIKWLWEQPLYLKIRNILIKTNHSETPKSTNSSSLMSGKNFQPSARSGLAGSSQQRELFQSKLSSTQKGDFTEEEIKWIEDIQKKKLDVICVLHPGWRGIHAGSEQMFDVLLEIPDNLDPETALHYSKIIAETGCTKLVISGFPVSYRYFVLALKQYFPQIQILIIYHGQYNQFREDYDRLSYTTMLNLAKSGKVDKLGFIKAGMAEVVAAGTGVKTGFLMNWMDKIPEKPSQPLDGGPHLGMWLLWSGNWRKPPFTMLASSLLIPGSIIHGSDTDERMKEYIQLMNIRADFVGRPLPRSELMDAMSKMHLNMYVTFHECSPMLPLESLSVGVPCIFGPVSHYFEDGPYLHQRLVVPYPERAEVVASIARQAIEERDEIIKAYQIYAPGYNDLARQKLIEFLTA